MYKTVGALCLFLALCCATPAFSQTSPKDAKIEKLLVSMNMDKLMDNMFRQVQQSVTSQFPSDATPEEKQKFAEMQTKIFDLMKERMSWEKMRPQYVKLYSDTFTDQEIDGIVAFYDSPAGKAMLAKTPELMNKSMALAQDVLKDIMPQIQQIAKDAVAK